MRRIALLLLFAAFAAAQEEDEGDRGQGEAQEGGLDALAGAKWKAKPIDFTKVDRTIRKLPELKAEKPLYALFLFGPEGKTRVWVVLDKSESAKKFRHYDILYLDRNADGDLTGKDERIAPNPKCGMFDLPDFKEPGTEVVHTRFGMTYTTDPAVWSYSMRWAGETPITGSCAFGASPADAPVFVPGTERPFDFAWAGKTLKRGTNDIRVRIGSRGDRDAAFSWVSETFLPEGEKVLVQLVCKDAGGTERKLSGELKERAEDGIYHGPVKIPKDAAPGPATLRVRLPKSSAYESFTTDIPVTIEK